MNKIIIFADCSHKTAPKRETHGKNCIRIMRELYITNSLSRKKEIFKPINDGHVGLYVCGPTVYGDAHLGHARPGVTYDVFVKLLKHLGYKVRYVRNITDVGHLEHDADEGEDKSQRRPVWSSSSRWKWCRDVRLPTMRQCACSM